MKKLFALLVLAILFAIAITPILAYAANTEDVESNDVAVEDVYGPQYATETTDATTTEPATPYTWEYLATLAGATAATLLIVQFLKVPLDNVWKLPTRVFVLIVALAVMIPAKAFTTGLTAQDIPLTVMNAFIVALTAYGTYEVTFAKLGK